MPLPNTRNVSANTANWRLSKWLMKKTPDHASEVVEKSIRDKEGERLMRYIRDDDYVITLEIGGKMLDSVAFSRQLENLGIRGTEPYLFCNRWFDRTWKRSAETLGLCTKFFKDDISTSADAGDPPGTDLQKLPDHQP